LLVFEFTTPPGAQGIRKGTAAYWQSKFEGAQQFALHWENYQTNPMSVGMMKPLQKPAVVTKSSKGRLTDLSCSFQMNDIQGLKRKKHEEDETEVERVRMDKNRRATARVTKAEQEAARKAKKDSEMASVVAAWAQCGGGCTRFRVHFGRELPTCPVKGLNKCGVCDDIQESHAC
jgi:hypothetical protein